MRATMTRGLILMSTDVRAQAHLLEHAGTEGIDHDVDTGDDGLDQARCPRRDLVLTAIDAFTPGELVAGWGRRGVGVRLRVCSVDSQDGGAVVCA